MDFSFCGKYHGKNLLGDDYLEQAQAIRAIFDELGLVCGQAHAPFDFEFCDEMKPEDPVFRNILRSIEAAAILGAPYIVVHPVLSPIYVDMLEYNLRFYRTLAPNSEKFGVKIAIENIFDREPSQRCMGRFGTPEKLNGLIDKLDNPCFVACCDTGHATITGTPAQDFIRGMDASRLRLMHVQDTDLLDDDHRVPYMGLQDWDAILDALVQIGYEGDFSMEIGGHFYRLAPELMGPALDFAAAVGRYIVNRFEALRK